MLSPWLRFCENLFWIWSVSKHYVACKNKRKRNKTAKNTSTINHDNMQNNRTVTSRSESHTEIDSRDCGTFRPHSSNAHAQHPVVQDIWFLVWAFAGRLCDKYHSLVSWLKFYIFIPCFMQKRWVYSYKLFSVPWINEKVIARDLRVVVI